MVGCKEATRESGVSRLWVGGDRKSDTRQLVLWICVLLRSGRRNAEAAKCIRVVICCKIEEEAVGCVHRAFADRSEHAHKLTCHGLAVTSIIIAVPAKKRGSFPEA